MSTGSTSASSSTLTSSSGGGGIRNTGGYFLPETFVDENGFQRPLNENQSRITGNTTTTALLR